MSETVTKIQYKYGRSGTYIQRIIDGRFFDVFRTQPHACADIRLDAHKVLVGNETGAGELKPIPLAAYVANLGDYTNFTVAGTLFGPSDMYLWTTPQCIVLPRTGLFFFPLTHNNNKWTSRQH